MTNITIRATDMELQDLRDEARDKENEAKDAYWKHVTTLDPQALAQ